MATGPSYRVPFRRRKEGKTDYRSRRALVLSRLPRLVVRRTSKHIIVQIVKAEVAGDKVAASAHSRELAKTYGWQGNCRNVPAAYLTGFLCGFKAMVHGVKKAVLDIGLNSPSRGARVFAALKGVLDAGVTVPHSENMIPDETRISGKHIADYGIQLSSNPEIYQQKFSKNLSRGLRPEQLSEHFSLIKDKITSSFGKKEKEGT
jgi:large subunit ribosomal protein L18